MFQGGHRLQLSDDVMIGQLLAGSWLEVVSTQQSKTAFVQDLSQLWPLILT